MSASVDLVTMNKEDHAIGEPVWNIRYERHRTIPASKVASEKIRGMHGFGFGVGSRTKRTDVHQCKKWLMEDLSRLTSGSYVHRRHAHIPRREPSQLYVQVV